MFYTYMYRDPRPSQNRQPKYIGKGTGQRAWEHWKKKVVGNIPFANFLSLLRRDGYDPIIEIVQEYETADEAFAAEIALIALYGRRDLKKGPLLNRTDGGEGCVGLECTPEFLANMKKATTKMWEDPAYREKVLAAQLVGNAKPSSRAKKSENSKQLWANRHEDMSAAIKAARTTPESRAKTGAQAKAMWADPEWAAKQTANIKEMANRAEVKAAKSEKTKAMWADPEWRAKMMAARKKLAPTNNSE